MSSTNPAVGKNYKNYKNYCSLLAKMPLPLLRSENRFLTSCCSREWVGKSFNILIFILGCKLYNKTCTVMLDSKVFLVWKIHCVNVRKNV